MARSLTGHDRDGHYARFGANNVLQPVSVDYAVCSERFAATCGSPRSSATVILSVGCSAEVGHWSAPGAAPPLEIDRSLDPRASGSSGAGWSSVLDATLVADNDGAGNMTPG